MAAGIRIRGRVIDEVQMQVYRIGYMRLRLRRQHSTLRTPYSTVNETTCRYTRRIKITIVCYYTVERRTRHQHNATPTSESTYALSGKCWQAQEINSARSSALITIVKRQHYWCELVRQCRQCDTERGCTGQIRLLDGSCILVEAYCGRPWWCVEFVDSRGGLAFAVMLLYLYAGMLVVF